MAILFCSDCGTGFWQAGRGHDPSALYGPDYFESATQPVGYDDYGSLEHSLRANFSRRLRALGEPPRVGARLLDVGSAYGYAVDEARRAGWRATGLELSPAAAVRAPRLASAPPVVLGDAQRAPFADGSFDAVTLWDVIEHLPDPHAAVGELSRLLRPHGLLALTTGDAGSLLARVCGRRWHLYTIPEHLFFYSRSGLGRLLSAHGLRVEGIRAESSLYPLGYLLERLRKTLLGRTAARPARFPGSSWAVPVNLFDVVTVRAVRQP